MDFEFSLQSISKCRNLLMGYAILGVLVGHIIAFGKIENIGIAKQVMWLCLLVHTPGFLFLSGFGVFYSLHKNARIMDFYQRRWHRFLFPYLILAIPFFLIVCYVNRYEIGQFFLYVSTIEFWVNGNYHGMWYIAISLLLYAITPLLFKMFDKLMASEFVIAVILLCISLLLCFCVKRFLPLCYERLSIGLSPLPMFYVGFLLGHISMQKIGNNTKVMMLLLFALLCLSLYKSEIFGISFINNHLLSILFVCLVFGLILQYKLKLILTIFDWLGRYTFEVYILHLYYWYVIKGACHLGLVSDIVVAVVLSLLTCAPVHSLILRLNNVSSVIKTNNK